MLCQHGGGSIFLCRGISRFTKRLPKRITLVQGVSVAFISLATGGALLYYESMNLHNAFGVTSQSKVLEQEKFRKPTYIYLSELDMGFENNGWLSHRAKKGSRSAPHTRRLWFSWLQSRSRDPLTLLRLAQSDRRSVRLLGVEALASQHHWHDSQYLLVAQASDSRTQIGLARSPKADPRFFLKPPPLPATKESLEEEMRYLLMSLPVADVDKCTRYFTTHALAEGKVTSEEREAVWSFDGSGMMRLLPSLTETSSTRLIANCLHALFTHSKVPSHCPEIVYHKGLLVLQWVYEKHSASLQICRNIARILSNIALHEHFHPHIVSAGWVTILARWVNSPDLALSMLASKALANLDADCREGMYPDGLHVYHPTYRYSEPVYADVVFIHGLLGGPFKTWRQRDPVRASVSKSPNSTPEEVTKSRGDGAPAEEQDKQTVCWPKDWLAKDFPHMRLLTLEYDTHLTEWAPKCPFESEKRTLAHRSHVILQKLREAGLGRRPIIWVGHSMGGLIIKNMLVVAEKDPALQGIVENSKGVVFYSVPHRGAPLAARSMQRRYLLYPSVEVEELVQGSRMLTTLHHAFTRLMLESHIPLLSFGEGKASNLPLNFSQTLVPPESSNPSFGEFHLMSDMNHLEACKPANRDSPLYQVTLRFIGDCIPQNRVASALQKDRPTDMVLSDVMN